MNPKVRAAWLGMAIGAAVVGGGTMSRLAAQQPTKGAGTAFTVDAALAKQGQSLFVEKGCQGCHLIGKGKAAGPDLLGVLVRRNPDWVRHWLKAPDQMLLTDSTARAMLAANNNIKMPNLKLTDKEVEALLHYIAQESAKHGGS